MAEEDAEIALLHQMQSGQENMSWGEGTEDAVEHSDQLVKEEKDYTDDQVLHALSPSAASSHGGEHTPQSHNPAASHATVGLADSASSSRASPRVPKAIGGFLADDSDDDDDIRIATSKPTAHLQPPAGGASRSISRSPLHLEAVPQESQTPTPVPLGVPSVAGATDHTPLADSAAHETSPAYAPAAAVASMTGASLPKARLPHDRVGILEDRIKEDPRGDMDAWLSLISEHRKRNKLDDARAVYERFFKFFPMAVCSTLPFDTFSD